MRPQSKEKKAAGKKTASNNAVSPKRCTRLSSKKEEASSCKKVDTCSVKKAKALKILRNKSVIKKTAKLNNEVSSNNRQLRPRFPYNPLDEWPTARAYRMASLNALAKVHILYENECRLIINDQEENTDIVVDLIEPKAELANRHIKESRSHATKLKTEPKPNEKLKKIPIKSKASKVKKKKIKKRKPKNNLDEVEIIDTKSCKRLACLNAQAILAASCEKIKKNHRVESSVIKEVCISHRITSRVQKVVEKSRSTSPLEISLSLENKKEHSSKESKKIALSESKNVDQSKEIVQATVTETCRVQSLVTSNNENRQLECGNNKMTEIREVTKVQINTTKEMEIKAERKVERKIERILEKDDVEITRMYRYKTKGKSQSYYLQMQTTYKPKNSTPPINPSVKSQLKPNKQPCYYPTPPPMEQPLHRYPVRHGLMQHNYGSAFTVPHYGHPISYPNPNDFNYYQPAGPMIQPSHDTCHIHKPVPFHPQHTYPPKDSATFTEDQCGPQCSSHNGAPPSYHRPLPSTYFHHMPPSHPPNAPHQPPTPAHYEHSPSHQENSRHSCPVYHHHSNPPPVDPYAFPSDPVGETYPVCQPTSYCSPSQQASVTPMNDYHYQMPPQYPPPQQNCYNPNFSSSRLPSSHPRDACSDKNLPCTKSSEKSNPQSRMNTYNTKQYKMTERLNRANNMPQPNAKDGKSKEDCIIVIDDSDEPAPVESSKPIEPIIILEDEAKESNKNKSKENEEIIVVDDTGSELEGEPAQKDVSKNKDENHLVYLDKSLQPVVNVTPLSFPLNKSLGRMRIHNWSWSGEPASTSIIIRNDEPPVNKKCYQAIKHTEGDIIKVRDCVLLKSGPRKTDIPFVAKIVALWEDTENSGEMMMSILWYYRPEHTEVGRRYTFMKDELFASKHRDVNSVACIEDRCYVLTFMEYCRYQRHIRMQGTSLSNVPLLVPPFKAYPRKNRLPTPGRVSPENILFCRKVYDFRQKRLLKNPS